MKLYKKIKGALVPVTLMDAFTTHLKKHFPGYETGRFSDDSAAWISIKREIDRHEIDVVISFEGDGNTIDGISVYKAPIVTKIDDDKQIKII